MAARISRANALKLSAWLAVHEPALFRKVLTVTQKLQRSPLGRFGYFGDDSALSEVVVNVPDTSITPAYQSVDTSAFDPTVTLSDVTVDTSNLGISSDTTNAINQAIAAPTVDSTTSDASQSSGSFWSSVANGVGSVAGSVAKVAGALISPQTIGAVSNAAASYFNAQAKSAQNQAQQAAVNAQLQRVAQGGAPAPITYVRDPTTGALTPVYASNGGYRPVTQPLLNRLTGGTVGASMVGNIPTTWLIGGGLAAGIIVFLLSASRR